jgi:hypothetical protein
MTELHKVSEITDSVESRNFTAVFKTTHNWSLASPRNPTLFVRSTLILFDHLCLRLSTCFIPSCFPTNILYAFLSHPCYMSCPSHVPYLIIFITFAETYQSRNFHYAVPSRLSIIIVNLFNDFFQFHALQNVDWLATSWKVRRSNPGEGEIFCTPPHRPWGTPSLLCNGYRVIPGGISAGAWR